MPASSRARATGLRPPRPRGRAGPAAPTRTRRPAAAPAAAPPARRRRTGSAPASGGSARRPAGPGRWWPRAAPRAAPGRPPAAPRPTPVTACRVGGQQHVHQPDRRRRRAAAARSGATGRAGRGEAGGGQQAELGGDHDGGRDDVQAGEQDDGDDADGGQLRDRVDPAEQGAGRRPEGQRASSLPPVTAPSRSSARAPTRSASWVTTATAQPPARCSASRVTSSRQVAASWPKVGSSSTSTRGAVASAVATDSRRCWPPDSVYGLASAKAVEPAAARAAPRRSPGRPWRARRSAAAPAPARRAAGR